MLGKPEASASPLIPDKTKQQTGGIKREMKNKAKRKPQKAVKIKGGFGSAFNGHKEKPAKVTGIVSLKLGDVGSKEKIVKI